MFSTKLFGLSCRRLVSLQILKQFAYCTKKLLVPLTTIPFEMHYSLSAYYIEKLLIEKIICL